MRLYTEGARTNQATAGFRSAFLRGRQGSFSDEKQVAKVCWGDAVMPSMPPSPRPLLSVKLQPHCFLQGRGTAGRPWQDERRDVKER